MTTATIKKQVMSSNIVAGLKSYKCGPLMSWKTAALDLFIIVCLVIGH